MYGAFRIEDSKHCAQIIENGIMQATLLPRGPIDESCYQARPNDIFGALFGLLLDFCFQRPFIVLFQCDDRRHGWLFQMRPSFPVETGSELRSFPPEVCLSQTIGRNFGIRYIGYPGKKLCASGSACLCILPNTHRQKSTSGHWVLTWSLESWESTW